MGDNRASVVIEFTIYGETYKTDMWINWSPDSSDHDDIDQRVVEWFRGCYRKARAKHDDEIWEADRERRERDAEERERAELARLKGKYEISPD